LSYFAGNMDEAYKAVKLVANPNIWENMAHMCVKSKRMDVASVCFGHMGHARGAKALRECANEPDVEANVAQVAIHLGLVGDAARLYQQSGRYDLLTKLYQDAGSWERAAAVATRHDRMHVKSTHYEHARFLEETGDMMVSV
jgi:intraflagellar transport protein 140